VTIPWAKATPRTHLGKLLTDARVHSQIPLTVLAAAVGVHKQVCCRLLNCHCPKLSTALALGRALGVKDELIAETWARDRFEAEGLDVLVYVDRRVK
jgi:hypothetical protein